MSPMMVTVSPWIRFFRSRNPGRQEAPSGKERLYLEVDVDRVRVLGRPEIDRFPAVARKALARSLEGKDPQLFRQRGEEKF